MKGIRVGIFVAILLCLPIWFNRATPPGLLNDSDTQFLLMKLGEYNDPWRWFTHDWPLENHFYRPISTLVFELDWRLHPGNAAAFGATNAFLCCLCALGVSWLAWELTQSVGKALSAQAVFVVWTVGWALPFLEYLPYVVVGAIGLRVIGFKKLRWDQILLGLSSLYVGTLLVAPGESFANHTLGWIPGRTATTMTVFSLVSLAAYVRFERLGANRRAEAAASAIDVPATRSSVQRGFEPRQTWGWFGLSVLSAGLAMGAYEQAVMIPFVVFAVGLWLRIQGVQARFALQTVYWFVLLGYIIVRLQYIPINPSGYQSQQFRTGPGSIISILSYLFPGGFAFQNTFNSLSTGLLLLLTPTLWSTALFGLGNVAFWIRLKGSWKEFTTLLFCAVVAYLPMAFLHQFGHYHYWPGAFMALLAVVVLEKYWQALVIAVSPQALQAPPRPNRAPGSLPRL